MSHMHTITPTLGDLRERIQENGPPDAHTELCFDLDPEDPDSRYLPDAYIPPKEVVADAARGEFDHLPDDTPLRQLASEWGRA